MKISEKVTMAQNFGKFKNTTLLLFRERIITTTKIHHLKKCKF
jgi:hypothetical protein